MSILVLLSAAVAAPAPAPAPVVLPAPTPDLSAPPSPHAPMRTVPRIGMDPGEAFAALAPVNRSARPRWKVSY